MAAQLHEETIDEAELLQLLGERRALRTSSEEVSDANSKESLVFAEITWSARDYGPIG